MEWINNRLAYPRGWGKHASVGWVVAKAEIKKQVDTTYTQVVEFRVAVIRPSPIVPE